MERVWYVQVLFGEQRGMSMMPQLGAFETSSGGYFGEA